MTMIQNFNLQENPVLFQSIVAVALWHLRRISRYYFVDVRYYYQIVTLCETKLIRAIRICCSLDDLLGKAVKFDNKNLSLCFNRKCI